MRRQVLSKCILPSLVTFLIIIGIFIPFFLSEQTFSTSPSFARQEVNDETHDVKQFTGIQKENQKKDYYENLLSIDIERISYSSDRNFLNATLWIGGSGVKENPSLYGAKMLAYGMLIDADNNQKTGKAGFDYQIEIQWSNGTWHRTLLEWASDNNYRILSVDQNYSDFFRNEQNYVLFSLDLNKIVSPPDYKLMFYSTLMYGKSNFLYDLSSLIDVPPPQYTLLTLPHPVVLRQGEQKIIGVQLKSNTGFIPEIINFIPEEHQSNIDVDFNPDKLNVSSFGVEPAPFRIAVSENAQIGQYTIPLVSNISTGAAFPLSVFFGQFNATVSTRGSRTVPTNLTISVIEPLSIQDQVKDFWITYGSLISVVAAGFAGAIATYVLDRLRKRRE
jgi:hypothetical protein